MEGMSIEEVRRTVGGRFPKEPLRSTMAVEPTGASLDTRTIRPGEVFFALEGARVDGHTFVPDALSKGASAAVVSEHRYHRYFDPEVLDGIVIAVGDPLAALAELGERYRRRFDIPFVAITGTNGKTTTKDMSAHVLSERFRVLKNEGSLNNHIGVPLTLLCLSHEHELAVLELGTSAAGEIARLCEQVDPHVGIITNVGPAHLESFGSVEGVAAAKGELLEHLRESDTAILNFDDEMLIRARRSARVKGTLLGFSLETDSSFRGERLVFDRKGCGRFSLLNTEIELALPGKHNVYNALAAAAVGSVFGVPMDRIGVALRSFRPCSRRRMEVAERGGVRILDDTYNANPVSVRAALDILTAYEIEPGASRIAILGDMLELGRNAREAHEGIGRYVAARRVDDLLTVGPLSEMTSRAACEAGMDECHARYFGTKAEAWLHLRELLGPGDVVLIKGSRGMAMEEIVEKIGESLGADDRR